MSRNSVYDATPAAYDKLRDCWLNERRLEFISDFISSRRPIAGSGLLEVGSGTGWLLRRLASRFADLRFVGLEPVSAYVEFSRQNLQPNCDFVVGAAEEASRVISDRFDYIISNDVLHHVASFGAASKELAKLAKPGAVWLILEPNWKNPYVLLGSTQQPGERNFWPGAFERAAGEWGWRRCQKGHLFLIPPFIRSPPGWLKRLEKRWEGVPWLAGGVFLALTLQQRPE